MSVEVSEASGHPSDPAQAGRMVERLLGELQAMVSPLAWQRIEQLVQTLVDLYGAGLERLLANAVAEDRNTFAERVAGDELLASLLSLHGLHPHDPETRVRRAIEAIEGVQLINFHDGKVRISITDAAMQQSAGALETMLHEVAPEIRGVVIEGLAPPPPEKLVHIDLARSRR
jgi:hypothetical protein